MYEKFYGLKEKPFSLTPDPEFLFINERFRGALDNVLYGIERHEGFTAIVGDVGTGKTTLCWTLLGKLGREIRTALILNPLMTEEDMLKAIIQDFGIQPQRHANPVAQGVGKPPDPSWMQGLTRKELIDELNLFLLEGADKGLFSILIIDEAQNLTQGVLEQLRILSNLETAKQKLLQIIFVGQLEFEEKLRRPDLRQLAQRITIRYALKPLSREETFLYIDHRLSVAGSKRSLAFTKGALNNIYAYSRGYPRLINVICDRSLLAGFNSRSHIITSRIVRRAAHVLRGSSETARKVRFVASKRVIVPIAALLVLAIVAALFVWGIRGESWFNKTSHRAAERPVSDPGGEPQREDPDPVAATPSQVEVKESAPPIAATLPPAATRGRNAPAQASPQAASEPEAPLPAGYRLQVHSLTTRREAEDAARELIALGYSSFSHLETNLNGRQWYVVYTGPYESLDRARADAIALQQQQGLRPIIRR